MQTAAKVTNCRNCHYKKFIRYWDFIEVFLLFFNIFYLLLRLIKSILLPFHKFILLLFHKIELLSFHRLAPYMYCCNLLNRRLCLIKTKRFILGLESKCGKHAFGDIWPINPFNCITNFINELLGLYRSCRFVDYQLELTGRMKAYG